MRYIIKFNDFSTATEVAEKHNLRFVQMLPRLGMLIFEYDPYRDSTDLTLLRQEPSVKYVQPDEVVALDVPEEEQEVSASSTSPSATGDTYIANFSNGDEYYGHLELLNSVDYENNIDVHDYSTTSGIDGTGVDIYIIDTGVNFSHPNLSGRVFRSPQFDLNLEDVQDEDNHGHGTTSALCAAGTGCGVAQNARIYSLKALGENKSGYGSDILAAIDEVIRNASVTGRPSICNLSLGIFPTTTNKNVMSDQTGWDHYLNDGAKSAVTAGVHVTIAAGNGFYGKKSDTNPTCTSDCDDTIVVGPMQSTFGGGSLNLSKEESGNYDAGQGDVVVVGATESKPGPLKPMSDPSRMASFSNYGYGNTINAVGAYMLVPQWYWGHPGDDNDIYKFAYGTSFACPLVSGLMALRLNDVPTESPAETKTWLVDSASSGNITNLSRPLVADGVKRLRWSIQSLELTIELVGDVGSGFSQHFLDVDIMQYHFNDSGITLPNYQTWKSEVADYNDGWWIVKQVEDNKLVLEPSLGLDAYIPSGSSTPVLKVGADFDFEFSEDLTVANVTNMHEETDGVKEWQTFSSDNILTGAGYRVKETEYTDNLTAYNPYQEYAVDWGTPDGQKPKIVLPDAFSDSPLSKIKLKTSRNESPIQTDVGISGLSGISINEQGDFESTGFNSKLNFNSDLSGEISVGITNGYKSVTETMEVVDNTTPPNTLSGVKNLVWYGYCGAKESYDLESASQIHSVYQLKEGSFAGSLVWKHDVPAFIAQPFTKLEPGHGYYIILKSADGVTPDETITIPNAVVSGVNNNGLEIGVC